MAPATLTDRISLPADVSPVDTKLAEARFFLVQLSRAGSDTFAAECYLSAFLSAGRSVSWALQAALGDVPGFNDWYVDATKSLRSDAVARDLKTRRDKSIHVAETHIRGGSLRLDQAGRELVEHYFASGDDVVAQCTDYYEVLASLVRRARMEFPDAEPNTLLNPDYLRRCGLPPDHADKVFGARRGTP